MSQKKHLLHFDSNKTDKKEKYNMAIYLVNQGKTYQYERAGSYIWSPKLNKAGGQNRGYNLMKSVRKGDFIIHNSGRKGYVV